MTNYNERLDEILTKVLFVGSDSGKPNEWGWQVINEAKASILELIKEVEPRVTNPEDIHPKVLSEINRTISAYTYNLNQLFKKEGEE